MSKPCGKLTFTYEDWFLYILEYGRTKAHRINMKYDTIIPLQNGTRSNIFELTMLDVGVLHEYEIHLENREHDGAYFISTMYIYRGQYYE